MTTMPYAQEPQRFMPAVFNEQIRVPAAAERISRMPQQNQFLYNHEEQIYYKPHTNNNQETREGLKPKLQIHKESSDELLDLFTERDHYILAQALKAQTSRQYASTHNAFPYFTEENGNGYVSHLPNPHTRMREIYPGVQEIHPNIPQEIHPIVPQEIHPTSYTIQKVDKRQNMKRQGPTLFTTRGIPSDQQNKRAAAKQAYNTISRECEKLNIPHVEKVIGPNIVRICCRTFDQMTNMGRLIREIGKRDLVLQMGMPLRWALNKKTLVIYIKAKSTEDGLKIKAVFQKSMLNFRMSIINVIEEDNHNNVIEQENLNSPIIDKSQVVQTTSVESGSGKKIHLLEEENIKETKKIEKSVTTMPQQDQKMRTMVEEKCTDEKTILEKKDENLMTQIMSSHAEDGKTFSPEKMSESECTDDASESLSEYSSKAISDDESSSIFDEEDSFNFSPFVQTIEIRIPVYMIFIMLGGIVMLKLIDAI